MTPADLYRDCGVSAWRVEALQHYTVPGDEDRQQAFREGRPLPPPRQDKLDDLALIGKLRESGRQAGRIHVVDWPLSPYVEYEIAVYAENAAAGEDVRIADRSLYPELGEVTEDFVIFDAEAEEDATVILFDYDADGLVRGYKIIAGRAAGDYREMLALAYAYSVPLSEFTAAAAGR